MELSHIGELPNSAIRRAMRAVRSSEGMSQVDAGEQSGVGANRWHDLERGNTSRMTLAEAVAIDRRFPAVFPIAKQIYESDEAAKNGQQGLW